MCLTHGGFTARCVDTFPPLWMIPELRTTWQFVGDLAWRTAELLAVWVLRVLLLHCFHSLLLQTSSSFFTTVIIVNDILYITAFWQTLIQSFMIHLCKFTKLSRQFLSFPRWGKPRSSLGNQSFPTALEPKWETWVADHAASLSPNVAFGAGWLEWH